MKILITGAGGFLGTRLARALVARSRPAAGNPPDAPRKTSTAVTELVLVDRTAPAAPALPKGSTLQIRCLAADVASPDSLRGLFAEGIDSVFALAATLTVESESNFEHGMAVNLHGLIALLEVLRERGACPRLVFASSLAAFGGPLPEVVGDEVAVAPQTSYGTQKAIGELLVNDYSRHGFIDGRCLRLPIVMTRHDGVDALPMAQRAPTVSGAIASLVGDRLLGHDIVCPLRADTRIAAASAERVIDALLAVHDLPAAAFGHFRAMNLPSLSLTLAELAAASGRAAVKAGVNPGALHWAPDMRFQQAVDQWPKRFESARATQAGIAADPDADAIVAAYLRDNPRALAACGAGDRPGDPR